MNSTIPSCGRKGELVTKIFLQYCCEVYGLSFNFIRLSGLRGQIGFKALRNACGIGKLAAQISQSMTVVQIEEFADNLECGLRRFFIGRCILLSLYGQVFLT